MKKVVRRTAEAVADATIELLLPHKDKVLTISADNGKEFALHEKIAKKLACNFYFAHPYSSWERGLNENINGLIRQFFPKGSSLEKLSGRSFKRVKGLLNSRPRKGLGYLTSTEV
jgi:IS30 family transposase